PETLRTVGRPVGFLHVGRPVQGCPNDRRIAGRAIRPVVAGAAVGQIAGGDLVRNGARVETEIGKGVPCIALYVLRRRDVTELVVAGIRLHGVRREGIAADVPALQVGGAQSDGIGGLPAYVGAQALAFHVVEAPFLRPELVGVQVVGGGAYRAR